MLNTIKTSLVNNNIITLENYKAYFANPSNLLVVKNTLKLGFSTVICCGIIGTFLAFYVTLIKTKFTKILRIILLTPMMVPGVIIVIAFIQLYGESGLITKSLEVLFKLKSAPFKFEGFSGILFVHSYTQYVFFYLNVSVALRYLDLSSIEAAKSLGASKLKIFFTVILPSILPSLFSSTIVTFISGISSFSAPNLIGGRFKVLSTQILMSKANNHINIASVQVTILLIMGISMLLIVRHYEKKHSNPNSIKAVRLNKIELNNKYIKTILNIIVTLILLLIILPILAIIFLSFVKPGSWMIEIFPKEFNFDNYITLFTKKRVLKPFINSIFMSIIAVIVSIFFAVPLALTIAKRKSKINSTLEVIAMLPWAMPSSTIAINLINTFNTKNIFAFNNVLIGRYYILPIAYIITAIPIILRTSLIAVYKFNKDLEDASKSLGANNIITFFKITVPQIKPAIVSSGSLVFIRCLGEYTMSALLYGVSNKPISIAMVNAMNEFDIGLSMSYGVLTIIICFVAMIFTESFDDAF
ncbi:iron ABC transporter permease [Sedimentibacter sp. zth1]|nr:iron ABC transporter permease [Sedimentibacter sp. zth1]